MFARAEAIAATLRRDLERYAAIMPSWRGSLADEIGRIQPIVLP
jgi:hypothetical protein